MAAEPKVSVVMSVYNGAKYLREAVDAVLAQTFSQFELIIVDDGSVDGTQEILAGCSDARIRLLRNDRNLGPAVARNRALAAARGEYIAIQDADDASAPARLATHFAYLRPHPDVVLLGSAVLYVQTNDTFRAVFPECADFDFGGGSPAQPRSVCLVPCMIPLGSGFPMKLRGKHSWFRPCRIFPRVDATVALRFR